MAKAIRRARSSATTSATLVPPAARRGGERGRARGGRSDHAFSRAWRSGPRLSARELAQWLRQIATLLRAGVPLVAALDNPAVSAAIRRAEVRAVLRDVAREVEAGASLSIALGRRSEMFEAFAVQLVVAGETAGNLDEVLLRIALRAERAAALQSSVRRALIYPAIVVAVATGAVAMLLVFVVPVFAEIFAEFGEALPLPTLAVVRLSDWVVRLGPVVVPIVLGVWFLATPLRRDPRLRERIDAFVLHVPVCGPIVRSTAAAQAIDTLGALVRGGVPIFDGLAIAQGSAGNAAVARALGAARRAVADGLPLAVGLDRERVLPPATIALIAVGEESGTLDAMLESAAALTRADAERGVADLLNLLEPAIVLALAAVVGFVVLAMYLPIFRLGGVVH